MGTDIASSSRLALTAQAPCARPLLIPGQAPRLVILLLLWVSVLVPVRASTRQGTPGIPSQGAVSQIAPDFAIITEVSLDTPYVGQQFCIIYKLRAQHPPAAVDIDPQQYSGFWTELIPIAADSASAARVLKAQGVVEYLLRQVIAYPLQEGEQKLPPLSLKVKRVGNTAVRREDWDVIGASVPGAIEVLPLPPRPQSGPGVSLVGGIEGALRWAGSGRQALILEIQGTANLALFKPLDWLRPPVGVRFQEQLAGSDNLTQTTDIEGKRQLSLLQRQRWLISLSGTESGQRIDGFFLPVFDPLEKTWKDQRIEGLSLPGFEESGGVWPGSGQSNAAKTGRVNGNFLSARAILAGALTVLAAVSAVIYLLRRRRSRSNPGAAASIEILEKKLKTSPRAFLDGAHKVLLRYAAEMQRSYNLGAQDTPLDRCWITVQKYRFNLEPVAVEVCEDIFQSIKDILSA
jgi:hypothetical protein